MESMIKILNEDCNNTLDAMIESGDKVDIILTSPPYNTCRDIPRTKYSLKHNDSRYDVYRESMTSEEYIEWTIGIFNKIEKILVPNGVILYNISYAVEFVEQAEQMWRLIVSILDNTSFTIGDRIIWKKASAFPNNVSPNKLTRIVEDVFVFCRKDEFKTYKMNKPLVKVSAKTGQNFYGNMFNFVEARNNDGRCDLNTATYSTELCEKLLSMFVKAGDTVYDPFMGTGTTGVACQNLGMNFIGSEISKDQCIWAENRLAVSTPQHSKVSSVSLW